MTVDQEALLLACSIGVACRVGNLKVVADSLSRGGEFLIETKSSLAKGSEDGQTETYSVAIEYPFFQHERVYGPLEHELSATNVEWLPEAEDVEEAWRRTILPIWSLPHRYFLPDSEAEDTDANAKRQPAVKFPRRIGWV